jgi:hypothetical protein
VISAVIPRRRMSRPIVRARIENIKSDMGAKQKMNMTSRIGKLQRSAK